MSTGIDVARGRARRALAAVGVVAMAVTGVVLFGGQTEARALGVGSAVTEYPVPGNATPGIAGPVDAAPVDAAPTGAAPTGAAPAGAAPAIAPLAGTPFDWELPAGVQRVGQTLVHMNDAGEVTGSGAVSPGRTFFYAFRLQNLGEAPVTVTGFESNFTVVMHPDRQGSFPADHCMQFFETRDFEDRQAYPVTLEPGETETIGDNQTYHYIRGPVSNECQQASFFFGPPSFQTAEIVSPQQPAWREATCDVPGVVIIPEAEGVEYAIDGLAAEAGEHEVAAGSAATVTATPAEGFEFPEGTVAEWTHAFAEPDCGGAPEGDEDAGGASAGQDAGGGQDADGRQDAGGDQEAEGNEGTGGDADVAGAAGSDPAGSADASAGAAASGASDNGGFTTPVELVTEPKLAATGADGSAPLWAGGALVALLGAAMLIRSRLGAR